MNYWIIIPLLFGYLFGSFITGHYYRAKQPTNVQIAACEFQLKATRYALYKTRDSIHICTECHIR